METNLIAQSSPPQNFTVIPDQILTYKAADEIFISAYTPKLQGKYIRVYLDEFESRAVIQILVSIYWKRCSILVTTGLTR